MSGTSLDGVDLALCQFNEQNDKLKHKILYTKTIPYSDEWIDRLQNLTSASAREYVATDHAYGKYLGLLIKEFCQNINQKADYIGSHGHTIFHEPNLGYTAQIGNPTAIYAQCETPVIADFRSMDVQYGGTGAPLVPIGDQILFKNHICVNLGGIANLSYFKEGESVAYDISPFNILLNYIAQQTGQTYDKDGQIGSKGIVNVPLLQKLNNCKYYKKSFPKSLDKTWIENYFFPIINNFKIPLEDKQRTIVEHLMEQIHNRLKQAHDFTNQKVLFTGGGTHNLFFMNALQKRACYNIIIPSKELIDFKEALIFAFLAYRKTQNKHNVLAQVTGAKKNVSSGVLISEMIYS